MSQRKTLALATLLLAATVLAVAVRRRSPGQPNAPDRTWWFREAKFGLFIHWGACAILGREEWARRLLQIPRDGYRDSRPAFDPAAFDPDGEPASRPRTPASKYAVITAKHHDGFALYDSAVADFDVKAAKYGRDILGPLSAAAMRQAGLPPRSAPYSIMDRHLSPTTCPAGPWTKDNARTTRAPTSAATWTSPPPSSEELVCRSHDPADVLWFGGRRGGGATRTRSNGRCALGESADARRSRRFSSTTASTAARPGHG
ncbi:MAG: alpha-L-fucosidase [Candidatus Moduliflexus flocculans]|nr:alpha-L-fucosidase [Candidatus Moduliflexus flocculans]